MHMTHLLKLIVQSCQFLGNDGLWLALMLFLASRGIGMHVRYRTSVLGTLPPGRDNA